MYHCHVSARNLPATVAPQRIKMRHPAVQAGWEKGSPSRLETGTSRAICAMARAWRFLAGGHLKRHTTHWVKHSEQLPTQSGTLLPTAVHEVKDLVRRELRHRGIQESKHVDDRSDLPLDFRFMAPVMEAAEDPMLSLRDFARGVSVGPGAWLSRQPALYKPNKKWWRTIWPNRTNGFCSAGQQIISVRAFGQRR